jgi:hypothetical protein
VAAVDASKILGIRAGARSYHRFTGVWPVVIDGRVFARSWASQAGGWYQTLLEERAATLHIDDREIRVRAVRVRSERIRDAVTRAFAAKYTTPGSLKYVRGFRSRRRREATIEFVPR